jgi:transposase
MLGLDGFVVLDAREAPAELVITIETTADLAGCGGRGVRAAAQGRLRIDSRDLACFGRPVRLVWVKWWWHCGEVLCPVKTWTRCRLRRWPVS